MSREQMNRPCAECGMSCSPNEYHPYAACLMFKACHNGDTVRANLPSLSQPQAASSTQAVEESARAWMAATAESLDVARRDDDLLTLARALTVWIDDARLAASSTTPVSVADVCAAMDRIPLSERKPPAPLSTTPVSTQPVGTADSVAEEVKAFHDRYRGGLERIVRDRPGALEAALADAQGGREAGNG